LPSDAVVRSTLGDYLPDLLRDGVSVVIILDGTTIVPRIERYVTAVRAVIGGLAGLPTVERVVAITYCPGQPEARDEYRKRALRAEEDLRSTGIPLIVLRSILIVGTPREAGPSDLELFLGPRRRVWRPGSGKQRIHPLLIEDLAEVVAAAALKPATEAISGTYELGGPEELSADDLIKTLNGQSVPIGRLPALLVRSPSHIPPRDVQPPTPSPEIESDFGKGLRSVKTVWTEQAVRTRSRSTRNRNRAAVVRYARPPLSWFAAGFFALIGIPTTVVGFHDLFVVSEVGVRITSVFLILAGAVLCFGAVALLLVRWRTRFALGILGSVVAFLVALFLLLARLSSGDPRGGWDWLWPSIMLLSTAIALMLWRRGGPLLRASTSTKRIRALASAITIGAIVSAAQFWYSSFYLPAAASPTISVDAELTKTAVRGQNVVLSGTVTAKNETDVRVNVLGSAYQVVGMKVDRKAPVHQSDVGFALMYETPARRYTRVKDSRVVQASEVMPNRSFFDKGEEVTRSFITYINRKRFDAAALRMNLVVARRKLVVSPDPESEPTIKAGTGQIEYKQYLASQGWLRALTRGRRYVKVREAMFSRSVHPLRCYYHPTLEVYVDREGRAPDSSRGCDDYNQDLAEFYGLVGTGTSDEVHLDTGSPRSARPAATQAPRDDPEP
jgi:hypothetical protein